MQGERITVTFNCPACGKHVVESTCPDVYTLAYKCPNCGTVVRPSSQDDCVFCTYGTLALDDLARAHNACEGAQCLPDRNRRGHAALGISPFNSYYSEERLAVLLAWSMARFDHVDAFVPDVPTRWTLEAGGYSPDEASRKTKRQIRYLENKIERAI